MENTTKPNSENENNSDTVEVKRQDVIKLRAEYLATQELVKEKKKNADELGLFAEKHDVYITNLSEQRDNLNTTIREQRKKVQETQSYLNYISSQLRKNEEIVTEVRKDVTKAKRNAQPVFSAYEKAHDELLKTEKMLKEVAQKLREAQMDYQMMGGKLSPQESIQIQPDEGSEMKSNPWVSGSFYVFAIVVVMTLLAVISSSLPWYSVAIVFASGLFAVSIIGALQLRNDKKLDEENFVKLMLEAMKQLPKFLSGKQ